MASPLSNSPRKASTFLQKKIGTPGSRRFQRFVNNAFLIDQQQKFSTALTTQDMEEDLSYPASLFHTLFENDEDLKAWHSFIAESEEDQDIFLMEMEETKNKKPKSFKQSKRSKSSRPISMENNHNNDNMDEDEDSNELTISDISFLSFRLIDKSARSLLKRIYTWDFVQQLDNELLKFTHQVNEDKVTYSIADSFQRMILHSICQYYHLPSNSVNTENGDRIVIIRKSKKDMNYFPAPVQSLSHFLASQ